MVGVLTSFAIELLQMFGGRYAEIDDVLINTLGIFSGYIIYVCIHEFKTNYKKAIAYLLSLCIALMIVFTGIYAVGNQESQSPDGLYAVESNIVEINVYTGTEERKVEVDSEVYHCFAIQIANILYWGNSYYQNCLDYAELTDELQEHKNEILEGYERLRLLIIECFHKS